MWGTSWNSVLESVPFPSVSASWKSIDIRSDNASASLGSGVSWASSGPWVSTCQGFTTSIHPREVIRELQVEPTTNQQTITPQSNRLSQGAHTDIAHSYNVAEADKVAVASDTKTYSSYVCKHVQRALVQSCRSRLHRVLWQHSWKTLRVQISCRHFSTPVTPSASVEASSPCWTSGLLNFALIEKKRM